MDYQNNNQPNYNQPAYTPPPSYNPPNYGAPTVAPKNIVLCIVLSFLTCGIYLYYWMYCLTEDVKTLSGDTNATSGGMVILLSIVTCGIYAWIWMYKQGERIDNTKVRRGMPSGSSPILYLILSILGVGIVSYGLMQNEINKLVA